LKGRFLNHIGPVASVIDMDVSGFHTAVIT
jgi:hypothetical protein